MMKLTDVLSVPGIPSHLFDVVLYDPNERAECTKMELLDTLNLCSK